MRKAAVPPVRRDKLHSEPKPVVGISLKRGKESPEFIPLLRRKIYELEPMYFADSAAYSGPCFAPGDGAHVNGLS